MVVIYVPGIIQEKLEPMNFTINNFSGLQSQVLTPSYQTAFSDKELDISDSRFLIINLD